MLEDTDLTRRKLLGSTALIGTAASIGIGSWAQLSDTEIKRVFTEAGGGLDLKVEGQDGVIRVPDEGTITLAAGDTFSDTEELRNEGSVPGVEVGINLTTRDSTEGDENPESETDTDPSNGGEFDTHLQIKAFLEQDGATVGYFYGSADSYANYADVVGGGAQFLTLPNPLDNQSTETTNLVFQLLYPDFFNDSIGDTLTFDIGVTLNDDGATGTPPTGEAAATGNSTNNSSS
jgi:hypothetical protein